MFYIFVHTFYFLIFDASKCLVYVGCDGEADPAVVASTAFVLRVCVSCVCVC